jgi:hypothetical protein
MSDKKPTPFTMTVCLTGVNHTFQFKTSASARSAYSDLKAAISQARLQREKRRWAGPDGDADRLTSEQRQASVDLADSPMHEIVDDCETRASVDPLAVCSYRLTDVANEHRANMRLKLAEFYAAVEFEEMVNTDHPALKLIKARQASPGLIMPK